LRAGSRTGTEIYIFEENLTPFMCGIGTGMKTFGKKRETRIKG
jgi:hypothetical protein